MAITHNNLPQRSRYPPALLRIFLSQEMSEYHSSIPRNMLFHCFEMVNGKIVPA